MIDWLIMAIKVIFYYNYLGEGGDDNIGHQRFSMKIVVYVDLHVTWFPVWITQIQAETNSHMDFLSNAILNKYYQKNHFCATFRGILTGAMMIHLHRRISKYHLIWASSVFLSAFRSYFHHFPSIFVSSQYKPCIFWCLLFVYDCASCRIYTFITREMVLSPNKCYKWTDIVLL